MHCGIFSTSLIAMSCVGVGAAQAQSPSIEEVLGLARVSGSSGTTSYEIQPFWTESLGFSVNGRLETAVSERVALSFSAEYGENSVAGAMNLGFLISDQYMGLLSYGMSNATVPDSVGGVSDVDSTMASVAISDNRFVASGYWMETNIEGELATTLGASLDGELDLNEALSATLSLGAETLAHDGVIQSDFTAGFDLRYVYSDDLIASLSVDHGLSSNTIGLGFDYQAGRASIGVDYTYINMHSGGEDHRVGVAFNIPIGGTRQDMVTQRAFRSLTDVTAAGTDVNMRGLFALMRSRGLSGEQILASSTSVMNAVQAARTAATGSSSCTETFQVEGGWYATSRAGMIIMPTSEVGIGALGTGDEGSPGYTPSELTITNVDLSPTRSIIEDVSTPVEAYASKWQIGSEFFMEYDFGENVVFRDYAQDAFEAQKWGTEEVLSITATDQNGCTVVFPSATPQSEWGYAFDFYEFATSVYD